MKSRSPHRRTQRRALGAWLGFWAAAFVAMHVPVPPDTLSGLAAADWLIHFAVYFVLAALGAFHLRVSRGRIVGGRVIGWACVYLVYAGLDEWSQQFVQRTPSVGDWMADAVGVIAASFAAVIVWRRESDQGRERHGDPRRTS